jgi:hypothetical protein
MYNAGHVRECYNRPHENRTRCNTPSHLLWNRPRAGNNGRNNPKQVQRDSVEAERVGRQILRRLITKDRVIDPMKIAARVFEALKKGDAEAAQESVLYIIQCIIRQELMEKVWKAQGYKRWTRCAGNTRSYSRWTKSPRWTTACRNSRSRASARTGEARKLGKDGGRRNSQRVKFPTTLPFDDLCRARWKGVE